MTPYQLDCLLKGQEETRSLLRDLITAVKVVDAHLQKLIDYPEKEKLIEPKKTETVKEPEAPKPKRQKKVQ